MNEGTYLAPNRPLQQTSQYQQQQQKQQSNNNNNNNNHLQSSRRSRLASRSVDQTNPKPIQNKSQQPAENLQHLTGSLNRSRRPLTAHLSAPANKTTDQQEEEESKEQLQTWRPRAGRNATSSPISATPTAMRMPPSDELEVGSFPVAGGGQRTALKLTTSVGIQQVAWRGSGGPGSGQVQIQHPAGQHPNHVATQSPSQPSQSTALGTGGGCSPDCLDCRLGHQDELDHLSDCSCSVDPKSPGGQHGHRPLPLPLGSSPLHHHHNHHHQQQQQQQQQHHHLSHLSHQPQSQHQPLIQHRPLAAHASVPPLPVVALDSALQARPPSQHLIHQSQHSLVAGGINVGVLGAGNGVGPAGHTLVRQATYTVGPDTLTDSSLSAATPLAYSSDGYNQHGGRLGPQQNCYGATTATQTTNVNNNNNNNNNNKTQTNATGYSRSPTADYGVGSQALGVVVGGLPVPPSSNSPPSRNQVIGAPFRSSNQELGLARTGSNSIQSGSKRDRSGSSRLANVTEKSSRRLRRNQSQANTSIEPAGSGPSPNQNSNMQGDQLQSHHTSLVSLNPCYSPPGLSSSPFSAGHQSSFGPQSAHQQLMSATPTAAVATSACQAFCSPSQPPTIPVRLSHRNYSPWMHLSSYFLLPVGLVIVLFIVASPLLHYLWPLCDW